MMRYVPKLFLQNLAEKKIVTLTAMAGMIAAVLLVWIVLANVFWIGFWGLFPSVIIVGVTAYRLPILSWFWRSKPDEERELMQGDLAEEPLVQKEPDDKEDKDEEKREATAAQAELVITDDKKEQGVAEIEAQEEAEVSEKSPRKQPKRKRLWAITPRKSPIGTVLIKHTPDLAVMQFQAAIRFWCWVLPTAFLIIAGAALPVGGVWGANAYKKAIESAAWAGGNAPIASLPVYIVFGAVFFSGIFIALSVSAYSLTRPRVRVRVDDQLVKFGSYRFDRKYAGGLRIGYSTKEAELRSSFVQPRFGVVELRFSYGRWGENTKYLVDTRHAEELVVWMNEIIESIGAPMIPKNDPFAGRKIELL
jgi:hypothetical protein